MKINQKRHRGIKITLLLLGIGVVGFLSWLYFSRLQEQLPVPAQTPIATTPPSTLETPKVACEDEGDEAATSGIFCSKDIGISFNVPKIFEDKLEENDGGSNAVASFSAKISGSDEYSLSITQEKLRDGDIGVFHQLQTTTYDASTRTLSVDKGEVPSRIIDGTKFYRASVGDGGTTAVTYVAVIKNKIVKVGLINQGYIGPPEDDPSTINLEKVLSEFDKNLKSLKVV